MHGFVDLFDSMPDTSFTKADPARSVDLFTEGTPYYGQPAIPCVLPLSYTVLPCHFVCLFVFSVLSLAFSRERKKINQIALMDQLKAIELSEAITKSLFPLLPFQHVLCAVHLHLINVHYNEPHSIVCVISVRCSGSKHHFCLGLPSRFVHPPCPHSLFHNPIQNCHGSLHEPLWWWVTHMTVFMNASSKKRMKQ